LNPRPSINTGYLSPNFYYSNLAASIINHPLFAVNKLQTKFAKDIVNQNISNRDRSIKNLPTVYQMDLESLNE